MVQLLAALARPSAGGARVFTRACEDRTTPICGGFFNHDQSGDQGGPCNATGEYGDITRVDSDDD
eukprot:13997016-Heterocapsa_arctica.AAC.1